MMKKIVRLTEQDLTRIIQRVIYESESKWFKTQQQGDAFRQWINQDYPKTAKMFNLDKVGRYDNSYISRVANYRIKIIKGPLKGQWMTLGDLFYYLFPEQKQGGKKIVTKKDSWGRPTTDKWYGFDANKQKFTEGPNKGKTVNDVFKKSKEKQKKEEPQKKQQLKKQRICGEVDETFPDMNTIYPIYRDYEKIDDEIDKIAKPIMVSGILKRIACEVAYIKIRPKYRGKNYFILDSRNHMIYLFDKTGKLIRSSVTLTGEDAQKEDAKTVKKALQTFDEFAADKGWKSQKNGFFKNGKKMTPQEEEQIWSSMKGYKFLPRGVYSTTKIGTEKGYAGKENNILGLKKDKSDIGQAIHGYAKEGNRGKMLDAAEKLARGNDNKELKDILAKNNVDLTQSFGCINVPEDFLPYMQKYGQNAFVFNMGEGDTLDFKSYVASLPKSFSSFSQNFSE